MNKVTVWQMTEEERLAYIEKHPICKTGKAKRSDTSAYIDWEWRSERATAASHRK